MSVEAINWALRQQVSGNDKVVLFVLANYADVDWTCFPSHETIAELACIAERTVRDTLNRLREAGLVDWEARNSPSTGYRSTNLYTLQAAESAGRPTGSPTSSNRQTAAGRREPSVTKRESAHRIPADWAPTAEHRTRAEKAGINLEREVERFKAHAEAHDRRAVRWNAAFTQWLITAEERKVVPFPQRAVVAPAPNYKTAEQVEADRLAAIEKSKQGSIRPQLPPIVDEEPVKRNPWDTSWR